MKRKTLEEFSKDPDRFMQICHDERVLVLRKGEPWVLLVSMENKDEEDLSYEFSPAFWEMIAKRRREPTIPLKDVKKRLLAGEKAAKHNRKKKQEKAR